MSSTVRVSALNNSRRRAALYSASSKPNHRSTKQMCPLNSPPKRAPVSFSLALMWECPVFHIRAFPPRSVMREARRLLHLTSKMISAPRLRLRMSRASSISIRSGQMIVPQLLTIPRRSPSPSNAMPKSARCSSTADMRSSRFTGSAGSGWWFGKFPSTSE